MPLVPSISLSFCNACNKVSLIETTNPYNALSNPEGWGGANTVTTSDITSAYVNVLPFSEDSIVLAVGVGTISGTIFTDTTHTSGTFAVGQYLTGPGILPGTQIVALGTGTGSNNGGTYIVNISQTMGPVTITGSNAIANFIIKDSTVNLYNYLQYNPTPIEGTIIYNADWPAGDGIYYVDYIVETSSLIYSNERQYELSICNLCACKDDLVLKLINASTSNEAKKLKEYVDQMEVFIYGIKTAFACGDLDTADAILTSATTYCQTISNCGCGCTGC